MKHPRRYATYLVALLMAGSAILLFSCAESQVPEEDPEKLMTQQSDTLIMISTENGAKKYRFYTPLMERYELAKEPYMEFRRGIDVVTYDSLGHIESTLVGDYAINFEKQSLWEVKGNVVATKEEGGRILETQQLFWNQKTGRIWSNVDTKVTQGTDVIIGEGFESDENMDDFTFRKPKGKVAVDIEPNREEPQPDSVATLGTVPPPVGQSQGQAATGAHPPARASAATPPGPTPPARGTTSDRNPRTPAPSASPGKARP